MFRCNVYRTVIYCVVIIWTSVGRSAVDGHPNRVCDLDCNGNGECRINQAGKDHCYCTNVWSGDVCTVPYVTCNNTITASTSNATQCYNGGKCEKYNITEDPTNAGPAGTRCSCQSLPTDTVSYAGQQCEFVSEQVCIRGANHSTYSFCVNGGTCKKLVEITEEHPLCDCPSGFGGIYCEIVVNVTDDGSREPPGYAVEYVNRTTNGVNGNETNALDSTLTKDDKKLSSWTIILIVLIVICCCSIPACYYIGRQRIKAAKKNSIKGSDGDATWATKETGKKGDELL
jgi:hypothetical protein